LIISNLFLFFSWLIKKYFPDLHHQNKTSHETIINNTYTAICAKGIGITAQATLSGI